MLLRYPGGKSRGALVGELVKIIKLRLDRNGGKFCEPFFGGGGISFALLKEGSIKALAIGDYDYSIAKLWNAVISQHEALQKKVRGFTPSVQAFVDAKARIIDLKGTAFDTLVVNRLSHGGRGVKAGPQGGYQQTNREPPKRPDGTLGKIYDIKCRWNPDRLCKDIEQAHSLLTTGVKLYRNAHLETCLVTSYETFLDNENLKQYLFYLDPPYFHQGTALYRCGFEGGHEGLREKLRHCDNWVLSYDNCKEILDLYHDCRLETRSHVGNGGEKFERELIITPL